jgi:hypothetical protein
MASASPSDRDRLAAPRGAVWEVGLIAMPTAMVQEDGRTVQPLIALVVEAAGPIRSMAVGPSDQPLKVLEPAIHDALHNPKDPCRPGLPQEVLVSQAELLELLPSLLPGVLIQRDATPQLNVVSQHMLMSFGGEESEEGDEDRSGTEALATYLTEDLGPDEVARFFAAAAALYQQRPWERLPGDGHLFKLSCGALAIQGWVGCVTSDQGDFNGVFLFESLRDFERYAQLCEGSPEDVRPAMDAATPYCAINFVAKEAMPPPLLEEIHRHGWPVAPGEACPVVMVFESPRRLIPPCRDDLERLEAVALALVAWIEAEPQLAKLWEQPSPKRRRFPVVVAGKRVSVTIGVVPMAKAPAKDSGRP